MAKIFTRGRLFAAAVPIAAAPIVEKLAFGVRGAEAAGSDTHAGHAGAPAAVATADHALLGTPR